MSKLSKLKISDLTIVTTSPDKLSELNQILGTNHKVSKLEIPEVQSLNLDEVISEKAKTAYKKIKRPVLVEDISLEIEGLNGLPGTFVKFFLKRLGTEGTVRLAPKNRRATKVTAAVAICTGKDLKIFKGTVFGTLSEQNRGSFGFGFDKVFIPKGSKKTYSEMDSRTKNKISHRAKALRKVLKYLK